MRQSSGLRRITSFNIQQRDKFPVWQELVISGWTRSATISLFTALIYWNDWINGLYYITDPSFFGIQNLLIRIMNNIQFLKVSTNLALLGTQSVDLPGTSVRMAMAVIGLDTEANSNCESICKLSFNR